MARREALGKGLGALIPPKKKAATPAQNGLLDIDLDRIVPSEKQPRKVFSDPGLDELAVSIRENGIIQPLVVRRTGNGTFELIAGERRWRASRMAGLSKVQAVVKDTAPENTLILALIENIQREDLNPLETAEAFSHLLTEGNLTQDQLSKRVGKDRATIANYLRLLKLAPEVKAWVSEGKLSLGHAKALVSLENSSEQVDAARQVIRKGLSVRETEALVKRGPKKTATKSPVVKNPQIASLEQKLIRRLGTKVRLQESGKGSGRIEINYHTLDELDRLLELLLS